MFDVLRGMISYVGSVKGKEDVLFLKLAKRFNRIIENMDLPFINLPISKRELQEEYTFVIESLAYEGTWDGDTYSPCVYQGTGFLLKGIGLITNYHVFKDYIEALEAFKFKFDDIDNIVVHRSKYSAQNNYAELIHYDKDKDIAILNVKNIDITEYGFDYNELIEYNQEIELIGYPDYRSNHELSVKDGKMKENLLL
jgi:hypothetical protein